MGVDPTFKHLIVSFIRTYYGLSDEFPLDQLLARTRVGKKRNLYLASKLVKELTIRNESSIKVAKTMLQMGFKLASFSFFFHFNHYAVPFVQRSRNTSSDSPVKSLHL